MKKTLIALAATLFTATGAMAASGEFSPQNRFGDAAPMHEIRNGAVDYTPTASIGLGNDYTADEFGPANSYGDAAPQFEIRQSGIDYTPTASIGGTGAHYTAEEVSPQNSFGDAAPAPQVLR
jgi:hypothetical protein